MRILFFGAGNMAQAIISGITTKKIIPANDIYIYDVNQPTIKKVTQAYKVNFCEKIESEISTFDVILLAVKPQVFLKLLKEPTNILAKNIKKTQIIISIMAGITLKKLSDFFGRDKLIIRTMPNTPALIGQSMTVISPSKQINNEQLEMVKTIFEAIGKIEILEENLLDAVTGLSGSGPGYVYTFIEAMIQGGILSGLTKPIAQKLAVQTVIGSALMINDTSSIEELRHNVTSPAGTTINGIAELEKNGFRSAVIEGIRAAVNRSKELSEEKEH